MTITETHRCAQFSQVTYTSCVLFHKKIHDLINGKSFATYLINDDSSNTIHACPTISPGLLALWEWCWYDAWIFIHCTLWILDFVLFLADMVDLLPVNNWFDGRDVSYHYIVLTTNMNNTTCVTTIARQFLATQTHISRTTSSMFITTQKFVKYSWLLW